MVADPTVLISGRTPDQLHAARYAVDRLLTARRGVAIFGAAGGMVLLVDHLAARRAMADRCVTAAMIEIRTRVFQHICNV
jgi:hypothetical protein